MWGINIIIPLLNQVQSAEGEWPKYKDLVLLAFRGTQAERWFCSAPEPRQPDWLGQTDAITVPLLDPSRAREY